MEETPWGFKSPLSHMKLVWILLLLLASPLWALSADRTAKSFQNRKQTRRVDTFDFSGEFPHLENIDIDACRKKCVEFNLSGVYPLLTSINYEGRFGSLTGDLTGDYPELTLVNLLCTSCAMQLDLTGNWQKSCQLNIRGEKEDIALKLPENVGLIIHTKTFATGKVIAKEGLKKQGWFHILKKTYQNELAETAPIVLTLEIETTDGNIILN
ncbi:MAG: hypothetical protein S4CHLAM2_09930 [Chlamydiales bacterium]|nr:hypothetical protein [Chlamydiales bacterium]